MAARNQALQNIRNARMLQQQQQNQGMIQMAPVQNSASMPASAGQPDMGLAYGGQPGGQQGVYGLNSSMNQMLQHPGQSGMSMGQRQPGAGQGVAMVGGYGQGMLMNPAMPQQSMKGPPVGQPIAKAQAQRLQGMMGGGAQGPQGWPQQQQPPPPPQQQQNLQAMSGRTSGEMAFGSSPAYPMQPGQPRMAKQHFPQGVGQPVVDPRAMNPAMNPSLNPAAMNPAAMNPAMGGQMMPHMAGQPRTGQPRPMGVPGMAQSVPSMTPFGQGPGQPMAGPGGSYIQSAQPQTYQRAAGQDLSYGYGSQAAAGGPFNLPDRTELESTDGWMEEFFPSQ
uniref:Mastermind-like protein 3 n=3 Tax=Scleropages formosus TaxID=113540 RepID=A0A8C9SU71_SCLFO